MSLNTLVAVLWFLLSIINMSYCILRALGHRELAEELWVKWVPMFLVISIALTILRTEAWANLVGMIINGDL